ncbi:Fc.00g095740.m01.CDS01 [Cosmosporella sp. VM-42]
MVFYYFGPDASSFAYGNDSFAFRSNLPPTIEALWLQLGALFDDKNMGGTRILWMSTTPDGTRYATMTKNGDLMTNVQDLLQEVKRQLATVAGTSVEHVCLAPKGGWLIRYTDSTVQLAGKFPDAFYTIAGKYLDISSSARQYSKLDSVWFGADESVIVKAGIQFHWDGIPNEMATDLTELLTGSLTVTSTFLLGRGTVLCPWEHKYYFWEAVPSLYGTSQYPYFLPLNQVSKELMTYLASDKKPPASLLPRLQPRISAPTLTPVPAPAPAPSPSNPFHQAKSKPDPATLASETRAKHEAIFNNLAKGGLFVSGSDAVAFMMATGLDTQTLSEIWELVDLDKNGKLDKSEFMQAMEHMSARLRGDPKPDASSTAASNTPSGSFRETDGHITCDGCSRGMTLGEEVYYCDICRSGDFDLCPNCYKMVLLRCEHQMQKLVIKPRVEPETVYPPGQVECDGCHSIAKTGDLLYHCHVCNFGDYDICEPCWKAQKTCGHSMVLRKLGYVVDPGYPSTPLPPGMPPTTTTTNYNTYSNSTPEQPTEVDKLSKQFENSKLKDSLKSSILTEKPNVKWEDVAGLEAAKAELQEAIIFPIRFPQMYRGKRKARRAILLYGPPGTGKSYLAKAVATEVDHTLFSVSSSDIMSKWIGESEGLMKQLFELARERKPSIIFIDEIDAICGARDGGGANGEDTARMKTEFLVQMDGVGNNNDGVFVLAATNLPWSLDPAVRRRFQKRIHAPLPDEKARRELFKVHLGDMSVSLGDTERAFTDLARRTNGYSGSDIANLVQDALMIPIKKVHSATHWVKFRDRDGEWFSPCSPGTPGSAPMKWSQVPGKQLKEPPLVMEDLYHAVSLVKPSVGPEEVRKCNEWTEQYGLEGA